MEVHVIQGQRDSVVSLTSLVLSVPVAKRPLLLRCPLPEQTNHPRPPLGCVANVIPFFLQFFREHIDTE